MDRWESEINQIDFDYATVNVIIFPFCALESVKGTFRMEYDQRTIVRFLLNEAVDAHEITRRLQARFSEHVDILRTLRFWIAEVRLACQDF
jgi:hypothetical protein